MARDLVRDLREHKKMSDADRHRAYEVAQVLEDLKTTKMVLRKLVGGGQVVELSLE